MNYKAGWDNMMLTNFLPLNCNGIFKVYAIVTDVEEIPDDIGFKPITVGNANAETPLRAIDTPTHRGSESGAGFRNQGWMLKRMPDAMPAEGCTISVCRVVKV